MEIALKIVETKTVLRFELKTLKRDHHSIHYHTDTMYPMLYFKWQPLEIIEIGNMNLSVYLRFYS